MFKTMSLQRPCPECGKPASLHHENVYRPFCSDRCRLIDLGEWASGGYRVPDKTTVVDFDAEKELTKSKDSTTDSDPEEHH